MDKGVAYHLLALSDKLISSLIVATTRVTRRILECMLHLGYRLDWLRKLVKRRSPAGPRGGAPLGLQRLLGWSVCVAGVCRRAILPQARCPYFGRDGGCLLRPRWRMMHGLFVEKVFEIRGDLATVWIRVLVERGLRLCNAGQAAHLAQWWRKRVGAERLDCNGCRGLAGRGKPRAGRL